MKTGRSVSLRQKLLCLLFIAVLALSLVSCGKKKDAVDYGKAENWAFAETDRTETEADIFFLAPTTYKSGETISNMPLDSEEAKTAFLNAINMEKGIYDDNARFFAPYYRQASLDIYSLPEKEWESYLNAAYEDVKLAFEYYLEHYNNGRPVILAGFSQGADHCIRLMKDFYDKEPCSKQIAACYALGWRFTEEDQKEASYLKAAAGETDTGVIITFEAEAEEVEDSIIVPAGVKTMSINPLNWETDSTPADRTLNLGACFTDKDGVITKEIPEFTGAYIDPERGTLKVTDVDKEAYPAKLSFLPEGEYHIYDYMFFYRNLEKNVQDRIAAFVK
ncbi:MAG: DUF3089 domain-containing protein [Eubacterium sp.]|nr:DUF3089 domain-containing protein [Eubacterium sp.]